MGIDWAKLREEKGWSQNYVAEKLLGWNRYKLDRIEKGFRKNVSPQEIARLCSIYGLSFEKTISQIYQEIEKPKEFITLFGIYISRTGFTFEELSQRAGIEIDRLESLINGEGYPSKQEVEKLAPALGCQPDKLLKTLGYTDEYDIRGKMSRIEGEMQQWFPRIESMIQTLMENMRKEEKLMRNSQKTLLPAGDTWTLQKEIRDPGEEGPTDGVIKYGDKVAVEFQLRPSDYWKDPAAEILGLWDECRNTIMKLNKPLRVALPDGFTEIFDQPTCLCIPGYDVDVEWRKESYMANPPWREVKIYVVNNFLKTCKGKKIACDAIIPGPKEGGRVDIHLLCPDYDNYLNYNWLYYKGLEVALSRNRFYRNSGIVDMFKGFEELRQEILVYPWNREDLRELIIHEDIRGEEFNIPNEPMQLIFEQTKKILLRDSALETMIPERFRKKWPNNSLDSPSQFFGAFLVLRGLVLQDLKQKGVVKSDKITQYKDRGVHVLKETALSSPSRLKRTQAIEKLKELGKKFESLDALTGLEEVALSSFFPSERSLAAKAVDEIAVSGGGNDFSEYAISILLDIEYFSLYRSK